MSQKNIGSPGDRALTQTGLGPLAPLPPTAAAKAEPARFRLGTRLSRSGQVYEAVSTRYPGKLVVKLFTFAKGFGERAVEPFTREAAAVADLRHPHIVQVFHAGTFSDQTPFVAMEHLAGQTLEDRIAGRAQIALPDLLAVLRGVASALSAAHAVGVVHGDVRADNVFIADLAGYELGFAKLLDFGVSRLTAAARAMGRVIDPGVFRTLAPEQLQGVVSERSDQFALAALAYRLLTGAEPTPGLQSGPAFARVGDNGPRPSIDLVRNAPELETVLAKALSRRAEDRFDTVAQFFHAVEGALAARSLLPMPKSVDRSVHGSVQPPHDPLASASPSFSAPASGHPASPRVADARSLGSSLPVGAGAASLTEQFFVDGDHQEANRWEGSPLAAERTSEIRPVEFESFDHVARRRKPMVAALLLALAGLGAIAWATGFLASAARILRAPAHVVEVPAVKTEERRGTVGNSIGVPRENQAVSTEAPPIEPARPAAGSVDRAQAESGREQVSIERGAPRNEASQGAEIPAGAGDRLRASGTERVGIERRKASPPRSNELARPVPDPAASGEKVDQADVDGPLRGYVWSPARGRLVRARVEPPPAESSPPPPLETPSPP